MNVNKILSARNITEFIVFNFCLFVISRFIGLDAYEPNRGIWLWVMSIFSTFLFPNIYIFSFVSICYSLNKFLFRRATPLFIKKALIYSICSFLLLGFLGAIWIFFIPTSDGNPTIFVLLYTALLKWALEVFQNISSGKVNFLALSVSGTIILIFPLIISWCITGVFLIVFLKAQIDEFKEQRKLANFLFISLKLSWVISAIFVACLSVAFSLIALIILFAPLIYNFFLFRQGISWNTLLILVISSWISLSIIVWAMILIITQVVVLLGFTSTRSDIFKIIHMSIWKIYFPFIKFIQLKVVPFTVFSPASELTDSIILSSLIFFQGRSFFTIDEVQIADNLANFVILNAVSKPKYLFGGNKLAVFVSKLKSLQIAARQMLLMGNITQSEKLYNTILKLLENNDLDDKPSKLDDISSLKQMLDSVLKELLEFYLRLNQKEKAKALYIEIIKYSENGNLFLVNSLSVQILYDFHMNDSHRNIEIGQYSSQINSNKLSELAYYLVKHSSNSWKIKKPQDLNKILLHICSDESSLFKYMFKDYTSRFSDLITSVKDFFVAQEKIFSMMQGQLYDSTLTLSEIKRATSEAIDFNILGISLSFSNPFIRENHVLIPLILVESKFDFSLEIIKSLTDQAIKDNRSFDLALLYCCNGKILIDCGEINVGFSFLRDGIYLFEGIRNSVSSDQLGIGFGNIYLKFYDWAIDAAIQAKDIQQAFDYSEHVKARTTLDLLCQRTSSSTSISLQKTLLELQNLDLSIALIDSSTYSKSSYVKFLPQILQENLRLRFYNGKKSRLQDLNKRKRDAIYKTSNIDPVVSSLIIFKPLSWNDKSIFGDYISTYEKLWQNQYITSDEVVISYHGLCNSQSINNRQWGKIVSFYLFIQDEKIKLSHYVISDAMVVNKLQGECKEIIVGLHQKSRKSYLGLISVSKLLVQPIIENLPSHLRRISMMGNDEFQFMPWSAIPIEEDEKSLTSDNLWLVHKFNTRVMPSLSLLFILKQREEQRDNTNNHRVSITGISSYPKKQDFLYWSGFEVNLIAKLYNTDCIENEEVDIHLANEFQASTVVHFSGHANYQLDESVSILERAYLSLYNRKLSAAQILDGALQSSKLKAMILSACLTGKGDLIGAGSEILGLERSLFYAGLSTLITTLWQVDELATALLMIKFHSIWKQHNNSLDHISSSLSDAQVWLKTTSLQNFKREIKGFDAALEEYIKILTLIIEDELNNNNKANIELLMGTKQFYTKIKLPDNDEVLFHHPCYWAAFQIKGVG